MKLIARIILIILFTYLLSFVLQWWIIIAISFIVGFALYGNGFNVFISGFLGGGLLWLSYAWYLDIKTSAILSEKIVELFPFNDNIFLIIGAGVVGGLCTGLGALTGNSFRLMFVKRKTKSFYS